jgi:hypothetical protein
MFLTSSTDLMFQNIKAQHHPASINTIQNINEGKRRITTSLHTNQPLSPVQEAELCFPPVEISMFSSFASPPTF